MSGAVRGSTVLAQILAGLPVAAVDVTPLEAPWGELATAVLSAGDGARLAAFEAALDGRSDADALRREVFAADPLGCDAQVGTHSDLTSNESPNTWEVKLGPDSCDAADLLVENVEQELAYLPLLGHDGYIVQGWSHLVAGYPRTGKTEMLVETVQGWLDEGVTVIWFTEEPRNMWRHRILQRGSWPRGLRLVFGLGCQPATLLDLMRTAPEAVVILDTIRNLLALQDERDNSEVARVVNPWIAASRQVNKTLILVHHMRKGSGEHGEGIAGGHALLASVDVALELLHDPTGVPNRRRIRAYARLVQPAELLYERSSEGAMRALGTPDALERAELSRRLLCELGLSWQGTDQVLGRLPDPKPSKEQARLVLMELARSGIIERDPPITQQSAQGKRVRWRQVERADSTRNGDNPEPPGTSDDAAA